MSKERKNGNCTIERGFTLFSSMSIFVEYNTKKNYLYVERWALEPYRFVWINPKEKIIFTYCEGDLMKVTCDNQAAFLEQLRENNEFYREFN